jgi:hypothetical protein
MFGRVRTDCGAHMFSMTDDKKRSFVDQIIAKKGHLIHKLKARDSTGRWAYYFVLVEPQREAQFLKAIQGDGTVDLEEYGKVIASCYGEEPSQEVKDFLKERYGFEV